jgi:hypothetical protein
MSMTITIDDDLSARLSEEARRRGQDPETVATTLLRAVIDALASAPNGETAPRLHNVMEFAGVGAGRPGATQSILDFEGVAKDSGVGMDAQEYVNQMRDEWEERERSWRS